MLKFLVEPLEVLKAGEVLKDLILVASRGGVQRSMKVRRDMFDDAAAEAGLEGLTPHELRHLAASFAVSSVANVKAVQRVLAMRRWL